MYKLLEGGIVLNKSNGDQIPPDQNNMDYQKYLTWVAQGNVPEGQ